jgi:hypothetical protein
MRYFNTLNMGEGLVGPSTVAMSTTTLHSCMGIVLANTETRIGGVFHYPALGMRHIVILTAIRQMIADVAPDELRLTPAAPHMGAGSRPDDIETLSEHLELFADRRVVIEQPRVSANLIWCDDVPWFNVPTANPPAALQATTLTLRSAAVPQALRAAMDAQGRQMEGVLWYYGGNAEIPGVMYPPQ